MTVSNRLFSEIQIGDSASARRLCTEHDLFVFAHVAGGLSPLHLPAAEPAGTQASLAASAWAGALVSHVVNTCLPGPGARCRAQSFTFHDRVRVADELVITVHRRREPGHGR